MPGSGLASTGLPGWPIDAHIAIVEPEEARARPMIDSLRPLDHEVAMIAGAGILTRRVRETLPGIVLIDRARDIPVKALGFRQDGARPLLRRAAMAPGAERSPKRPQPW